MYHQELTPKSYELILTPSNVMKFKVGWNTSLASELRHQCYVEMKQFFPRRNLSWKGQEIEGNWHIRQRLVNPRERRHNIDEICLEDIANIWRRYRYIPQIYSHISHNITFLKLNFPLFTYIRHSHTLCSSNTIAWIKIHIFVSL
jgi:hypothetical protein